MLLRDYALYYPLLGCAVCAQLSNCATPHSELGFPVYCTGLPRGLIMVVKLLSGRCQSGSHPALAACGLLVL